MLTAKQRKDYVRGGAYRCPYCSSTDITADHFEGEGSYQPVECKSCGRRWNDIYKLVDIEDDDDYTPPNPPPRKPARKRKRAKPTRSSIKGLR